MAPIATVGITRTRGIPQATAIPSTPTAAARTEIHRGAEGKSASSLHAKTGADLPADDHAERQGARGEQGFETPGDGRDGSVAEAVDDGGDEGPAREIDEEPPDHRRGDRKGQLRPQPQVRDRRQDDGRDERARI